MVEKHESYGMLSISRFDYNRSQFFGSDIFHSGGIKLRVSLAEKNRDLDTDWYFSGKQVVEVEISASQFIDAITSGMNTEGVPCTIQSINGKKIEQINHVDDKKDVFKADMSSTHKKYLLQIDSIMSNIKNGQIAAGTKKNILFDLDILRSHIVSNTEFVMTSFNKAMDKTITEAKASISNYIDNKVNTLGIKAIKEQLANPIDDAKEVTYEK